MEETASAPSKAEESAQSNPIPQTLEDLGIPAPLVTDLVLRYVQVHGTVSLMMLRNGLKLPHAIVQTVFHQLRQQQLVDVKRTVGNDYWFSLTEAGARAATARSSACRYAGPAPVSLEHYSRIVRSQRAGHEFAAELLNAALADLVLPDRIIDQLGTALISQKAIFLYGPTGTGKTSIVERLWQVFDDPIQVPYAVEVDSQIITVFDPKIHHVVAEADEYTDPRWIRCSRPAIMTGGELTASMLAMAADETTGVYPAPIQMKANNGLLLIDDLGRQAIPATQLLNRWMLPLDRRLDYLSLPYGFTFQIPFDPLVVFSTNLDPTHLADEAFLRRLPNKIYVGSVLPSDFDEIFRRVLGARGIPFQPELAVALREICARHSPHGLKGCFPNDLCDMVAARARFKRRPFCVNPIDLEEAAEVYFGKLGTMESAFE